MKTTEKQKEEAIRKLVKGYKKVKLNHEVVKSTLPGTHNSEAMMTPIHVEEEQGDGVESVVTELEP